MTIKLWVDDIRNPVSFVGEGWHWAKTVTEAIRVLDEQDVSEVSLDHDISMKVSVGYGDARPFASAETFEPVCRFVRQRVISEMWDGTVSLKRVRIHTANAVAAEKMKAILAPVSQIVSVEVELSKPYNRFEEDAA
jgi:hypothetical protein